MHVGFYNNAFAFYMFIVHACSQLICMYMLSGFTCNAFHDISYAVNLRTQPPSEMRNASHGGNAARLGLLGDWAVDRLHKMTQMAARLKFDSLCLRRPFFSMFLYGGFH